MGGGTPPRHDDRPRLRVDDPAEPGRRPGRGEQLAFVDVPGHERFVPNMLAGLGPVPAVLFAVAADGGWMPQSAEHLAAVDALGVRHGLLVVTRSDLADPGPATGQALAEIASTSLGRVEAVRSARSPGRASTSSGPPSAAWSRCCASPGSGPPSAAGAAVDRPLVHDQGRRHRRHRHAPGRDGQERSGALARPVGAAGPGPRPAGPGRAGGPGCGRRPGGAEPQRRPGRRPRPRHGADRAGSVDARDRARRPDHRARR